MKILVREALLVLCLGAYVAVGLSMTAEEVDPCRQRNPQEMLANPQNEDLCEEQDGTCYDKRCERCVGHWRDDLCPGTHMSCCLPESEPEYKCCEIYNDPHIRTFDGLTYDIQLPGWFKVTTSCCSNDSFSVYAEFDYPYAGASWTQTVAVMVIYKNTLIEVTASGVLKVNGNPTAIPYTSGDISVTQVGAVITISLSDIDVEIQYNTSTKRLKVCVGSRWFDELCGICGNANGNVDDDRDNIPPPGGDPPCPHPQNHYSWTYCRNALGAIVNRGCSYKSIGRYLRQCAFDMCADTRMGARMTLAAAREECASGPPKFAKQTLPATLTKG